MIIATTLKIIIAIISLLVLIRMQNIMLKVMIMSIKIKSLDWRNAFQGYA